MDDLETHNMPRHAIHEVFAFPESFAENCAQWLRRGTRHMLAAAVLAAMVVGGRPALAEDYRLQTGDVIDFSIASYADMQKKATVDDSGSIILPVLGRIVVRDLTLGELRQKVIEGMSQKSIPRVLPDGSENWVIFQADQITVDIGEYRPIFIDGDVTTPGSMAFRPGITIRQAIATAGGFNIARMRVDNPMLTSAELRGRYEVLRVKQQASAVKVARIKAQLGGEDKVVPPDAPALALVDFQAQALEIEQRRLDASDVNLKNDRSALSDAEVKTAKRLTFLEDQTATDKEGAAQDQQELDRVKALFAKGLIPITRVNDAQRAVLLSATRALQTNAEIARLEREQGDLQRSITRLDDSRTIDLVNELRDESSQLAATEAEMRGVATQLVFVEGLRAGLLKQTGRNPEIAVTRTVNGDATQISAEQDTPLRPGDAITVVLPLDDLLILGPDPAPVAPADPATTGAIPADPGATVD